MKKYSKTTYLVLCGIFAALMAICSYITIPLGFTPVPINLATLGAMLCGGILGAKYGTLSEVVYVFVGAVGIPVFAGFTGGIGIIAGPTGGYIIGYIFEALIIGVIADAHFSRSKGAIPAAQGESRKANRVKTYAILAAAMALGVIACYALGTVWFIVSTGTGIWASLISCVFPFIPGDILKIIAGTLLVKKLRPVLM